MTESECAYHLGYLPFGLQGPDARLDCLPSSNRMEPATIRKMIYGAQVYKTVDLKLIVCASRCVPSEKVYLICLSSPIVFENGSLGSPACLASPPGKTSKFFLGVADADSLSITLSSSISGSDAIGRR